MIEAAVILSAVARHWPDFGITLTLLIACELYEQRGRGDGQAGRDWRQAEREIRGISHARVHSISPLQPLRHSLPESRGQGEPGWFTPR